MDVKDIKESGSRGTSKTEPNPPTQKRASTLANTKVEVVVADVQTAKVQSRPDAESGETRRKINEAIYTINIAAEATGEIENIVKSISGIAEQATKESASPQRRAKLEAEANHLIDEIRKKAAVSGSNGVKPLAGDKIRLEIEEKLGKTLDFILPDDAKDAFGLRDLIFSKKDAIIDTITNIRQAKASLEELKKAVANTRDSLKSSADTVDVAIQNKEASEVSIRDVDKAAKLVSDMKLDITRDPERALESVGQLSPRSLDLLES